MVPLKTRLIEGASTTEAQWLNCGTLGGLPLTSVSALVPAKVRLVVLAPHPDDEILMAGGLLQQCAAIGQATLIIAVTDGEASHPRSAIWPPTRLMKQRPCESQAALARLSVDQGGTPETLRLGFPDGGLQARLPQLEQAIASVISASDVVLTTWRLDGHPDHDACGMAAVGAVASRGAVLIEAPVWMWHWSAPDDHRVPWLQARRLPLSARQTRRKQDAIGAFGSQLASDASTGAGPVLTASVLERVARPFEVFFVR